MYLLNTFKIIEIHISRYSSSTWQLLAGGAAERGAGAPGSQRVVQKQHQLVLRGAVRHRQVVLLITVHHKI